MNGWIDSFNLSLATTALLLCIMGLWFTSVIPGIDYWSRRFFIGNFIIFLLCCLLSVLELAFQTFIIPSSIFYILLLLECLMLSLPPPLLTIYLLHCSGEGLRQSQLLRAVLGLWILSLALFISTSFIDGFIHLTPQNSYYRGLMYPLLLLPTIAILLLNLIGTIKRRKKLSQKAFLAFVIAMLPIAAALSTQLFVDVYPLVDISYILSVLAMYSFILSDQIERDRRQQQEILQQQTEIARQQQQIAQERASIMILQMRPHFIYNTLMSIHSLCRLDPQKAQQITMDFTNYLRRNFNAVASDATIPFPTELEHTRAYLAVEHALYDDMLAVNYDTPYTHFRLPPLTLQPIVENAIKHGMDPDSDPLNIIIRTRHADSGTELIIEDTGPGFDPSGTNPEPHNALNNIRQRLEMMCGGCMAIRPRKEGGTIVTVVIPDSTAPE